MQNLPELLSALAGLITMGLVQWSKSEKDKVSVEKTVAVEAKFLLTQVENVERAQLNTNTSVGLLSQTIVELKVQQAATRLEIENLKLATGRVAKASEEAVKEIEKSRQQWISETLLLIKGKKEGG